MAKVRVPEVYRGLDRELTKVGRACVTTKAAALNRAVLHQHGWWSPRSMTVGYQTGDAEVDNPSRDSTTSAAYQWRPFMNQVGRWVMIRALTAGGRGSAGSGFQRLAVATDATSSTEFAHVDVHANGYADTVVPGFLREHVGVYAVSPAALENITVNQGSSTNEVRVAALSVETLPVGEIDTAVDSQFLDPAAIWPHGKDIVDGNYQSIALGVERLRRLHKKYLWSNAKYTASNAVGLANAVDMFTQSTTLSLSFDLDLYPVLPESVSAGVTVRILANAGSANNGRIRVDFGGGATHTFTVTTGAAAYQSAAVNITKDTDTIRVSGYNILAGTVNLYGIDVMQDQEAV